MGKNVYETPRNSNKWHTGSDKAVKNPTQKVTTDQKERLRALAERAKKNQEKTK